MNFFTSFLDLFNRTEKNSEILTSKEEVNLPKNAESPQKLLGITDHKLLNQLKPLLKKNQVLQAVEITTKYYSEQYKDMVFKDWYSLVSDLYKKEHREIQVPEFEKNPQSKDKIINETIQKEEAVLQKPNNRTKKKFTTGLSIPKSKKIKKSNTNVKNLFSYPEFLVFTTLSNAYKIQNKGFSNKSQIIAEVNFDKTEKPIYITGTKQYNGFLLVAFENGKAAKVSFSSFKTELKRKKLRNAFSNESKLIFIEHFESDIDLIALSSINKVALFNTCMINEKDSRTSKGVQVMKSKDASYMKSIKKLNQVKLIDPEYYRKDSGLNVVGYYLKQGDQIL
jgi:DNA gyrase/topoisomerase IV subunit A